jgi:hypothetical protein
MYLVGTIIASETAEEIFEILGRLQQCDSGMV